jgi:hypothetical protein
MCKWTANSVFYEVYRLNLCRTFFYLFIQTFSLTSSESPIVRFASEKMIKKRDKTRVAAFDVNLVKVNVALVALGRGKNHKGKERVGIPAAQV